MAGPTYAFGDTELAAQRLDLVADTFEEPSRQFILDAVTERPSLAVDLGCATGRTTTLLADTTGASCTVGLDWSEPFLARARDAAGGAARFLLHDVTRVPFPVRPPDVVYARLLLAHLTEPEEIVSGWALELLPRGLLLLDEVEFIRTTDPVLVDYEQVVVDLVASRGGDLEIGPRLGSLRDGDSWRVRSSVVREHHVPIPVAARMYAMNLATWREDPHVQATWPGDVIEGLANGLVRLAGSGSDGVVEWGLRQIVIERAET